MQRLFSLDLPFSRFVWNVFLVSLGGLVPLLMLYIALTPDFARHLAGGGPALWRFLRQVLTNGVPVVLVVNYAGFFLYAKTQRERNAYRNPVPILALDVSVRIATFILLHVLIYVLSADWFGSFGGSRATALRVVAPTLARSAFFENISGVYLYATLVSAIPLYVSAIQGWLSKWGSGAGPRSRGIAAVLSILVFGAVVALLTGIASVVTALQ